MELTTAWNGTLDLGVAVVSSLPTDIHFCWQKSLVSPSTLYAGFLQQQYINIAFSLYCNNRIEELEANRWHLYNLLVPILQLL